MQVIKNLGIMKRISIILALLAIVITSSAFVLLRNKYISESELPKDGQILIASYFKGSKILTIEERWNEYKILLNDGTKIKLDKNGTWDDLENEHTLLPSSVLNLLPRKARSYISSNFKDWFITDIEKKRSGYKIELINGASDVEIEFNSFGEIRDVDF